MVRYIIFIEFGKTLYSLSLKSIHHASISSFHDFNLSVTDKKPQILAYKITLLTHVAINVVHKGFVHKFVQSFLIGDMSWRLMDSIKDCWDTIQYCRYGRMECCHSRDRNVTCPHEGLSTTSMNFNTFETFVL